MTTLIRVTKSDGSARQCDARCYEAITPAAECECVCGGVNHGRGEARAMQNTQESAQRMIDLYAARHDLDEFSAEIGAEIMQLSLFVD